MDVMERVEIKDERDSTIQYCLYKGFMFPPHVRTNPRDLVNSVAQLKCQQDDVLLYTFPKSGTHWMNNILHMSMTGTMEYANPTYLEFNELDMIDAMPSPRLYATHLEVDLFPDDIKNGKGLVVNIIRNPKDVVVSYYCFLSAMKNVGFTGEFSSFLHFFLKDEFHFGSWFTVMKHWIDAKKTYPKMKTFTLYYEDLKRNTLSNLRRVVDVLGVSRDEEFYRKVIAETDFNHMKKEHASKRVKGFNDVVKAGVLPIYRKGHVGDWKQWFTPEQTEHFDRVYKERMAGYDLDLVFE